MAGTSPARAWGSPCPSTGGFPTPPRGGSRSNRTIGMTSTTPWRSPWSDRGAGNGSHQHGTTRMGDRPAASGLNPNCRAHEVNNVCVIDRTSFPPGTGANRTLTIMANAWRVSEAIVAARGAPASGTPSSDRKQSGNVGALSEAGRPPCSPHSPRFSAAFATLRRTRRTPKATRRATRGMATPIAKAGLTSTPSASSASAAWPTSDTM